MSLRIAVALGITTLAARAIAGGDLPSITSQPTKTTLTAIGGNVTLYATVQSTGNTTLQWFRDGVAVSGQTDANLQLSSIQPTDGGIYQLQATNQNGTATSQRASIEVLSGVQGPIWVFAGDNAPPDRLLLAPTTTTPFRVYAPSAIPIQIQWRHDGQPIAGATTDHLTLSSVSSPDSGVYDVLITNRYGSVSSGPFEVSVTNDIPLPTPSASWNTYFTAQPPIGADYVLNGGVGGDVTGLIVRWEYNGTPIPGANGTSYTIQNYSADKAGLYEQVVTNGRDRVVFESYQIYTDAAHAPLITTQPDTFVEFNEDGLRGNITTSAVGAAPLLFQWYHDGVAVVGATSAKLTFQPNQPNQAGHYHAVVTNGYGSATTRDVQAYFNSAYLPGTPYVTIDPVACAVGHDFDVHADSSNTTSCQWYRDGVAISGATDRNYYVPAVTLADAGSYTFVATNSNGSTTSTPVIATIAGPNDPPKFGTPRVRTPLKVTEGDSLVLDVLLASAVPVSCRWFHNGALFATTTEGFVRIGATQLWHAGDYSVTVTNANGSATTTVQGVVVNPAPTITSGHLENISTRGRAGSGLNSIIAGFNITGPDKKRLLIRGIGPGLGLFGMSDIAAKASIEVFQGQKLVARNDDWVNQLGTGVIMTAARRVGTFGLDVDKADAALVTELDPGGYTVVFTGKQNSRGSDGAGLVEVYDLDPGYSGSRLTNLSSRVQLATGEMTAIPGFVVWGHSPKKYLVRAVGPGLAAFKIPGYAADPRLELVCTTVATDTVMTNDDWQSGPTASLVPDACKATGAFPLEDGSKDAAIVVTLAPGNYSALVTNGSGNSGIALVEVYELP